MVLLAISVLAGRAAQPVLVTLDASRDLRPISPYVYGTNAPDWDGRTRYLTLGRAGGNRWTAYNWETNASNAGADWQNQSDNYLGGGDTPMGAVLPQVNAALSRGKAFLVTIPMAGYVSADKLGNGDVAKTPNYLETRFFKSYPNSPAGADLSAPPNTKDRAVYQDQFVANLLRAKTGSPDLLWFSLDNEPDLWSSTHSRIRPQKLTYSELLSRTIEYAQAIKRVDPKALVFGPASYGWNGYRTLQDAPDANGRYFLEFYLDGMREAQARARKRLLDVLDLHYYSEARGGGKRVTEVGEEPALVDARVQAPRSLYDPTYVEESWITRSSTKGKAINLLPSMRELIRKSYPGTKLAITEYNFGGKGMSAAIAQADALGAFGREGVFAAAYWPFSNNDAYAYGAFDMFRNYDGKGGKVGEASVRATSSDLARVSVWGSKSANTGRVYLVAINRSRSDAPIDVRIAGAAPRAAQVHRLTGAVASPAAAGSLPIARGRLRATLPAMSVSTFVLR